MKRYCFLTALLISAYCAGAADLPASTLGKALAAFEHAHSTHDAARRLCSIPKHHEIGWDAIEAQTRQLARSQPEPKPSQMFTVLLGIRVERQQLFGDHLGCAAKLHSGLMTTIMNDMLSLDDAEEDVEESIRQRVQNLERISKIPQ